MHIVMSLLNFRPGNIGGTETYLRALCRHMGAFKGQDRITAVFFRDNAQAVETPGMDRAVINKGDREIIALRLAEAFTPFSARLVQRVFHELDPDVVFFPQQSFFPKRLPFPKVLTGIDMQHLFFPQYFSLLDRAFRAAIYPYCLKNANLILPISQEVARTLNSHCGMDLEKMQTVPLGFDAVEKTGEGALPDGIHPPYLYYPAASLPHKGHLALLETFEKLCQDQSSFPYQLVLSGKRTAYWKKIQSRLERMEASGRVVHVGYLPYEKVWTTYASAEAVVFPTEFEGFGLPVLEAVTYGSRIITSHLNVFQEIGVPPENQIDFAQPEALRTALEQPKPTRLLHSPLSWEEAARKTLDAIRSVGVS